MNSVTTFEMFKTKGYIMFDAMLAYDLGLAGPELDGLSVAVNGQNLFDKRHVSARPFSISCYFGGRLEGFEEYASDEQFAVAMARLAVSAAEEARRLATMFNSLADTAEVLLEQARTEAQRTAHPGWMAYNAGVAAGLTGRTDDAAEMFGRVLNSSADKSSVLHLKAERMSNLAPDATKLRQEAASTIAKQRETLRLAPWGASRL